MALSMVLSVAFLWGSLAAVRRKHLREQSALLWLGISVAMVLMSATLPFHLLDRVAHLVGIAYPPDLILLLAVLFLFLLVFHLSLSLDRMATRQTSIAQEVGIAAAKPPPGDGGNEPGQVPPGERPVGRTEPSPASDPSA